MAADGGPRDDRTMNPPRLQDVAARANLGTVYLRQKRIEEGIRQLESAGV